MTDVSTIPERRLMQAVILNAIADACGRCGDGRRPAQVATDRRIAIRWFKEVGPDYRGVCELAGLHPETVSKFALAFIASGEPFPRINRSASRDRSPLSSAAIAAYTGVSVAAVRGVLKHDQGSHDMRERIRQSMRDLTDQQRLAA